jgi:hypothetical protein
MLGFPMRVYHGTTPDQARMFLQNGIDGHLLHSRAIHGPQDGVPGLFVTPTLSVARRFGLCIVEIEVHESELDVPPNLKTAGASLLDSLSNVYEPQAFLARRIEPNALKIIECHADGYPFNPYEGPEGVAPTSKIPWTERDISAMGADGLRSKQRQF